MSFSDQFFNQRQEISKKTFKVADADWKLIEEVFPEAGFKTWFPGFAVALLCEILREHNITTINERFRHPKISTIRELLSNIKTSLRTTFAAGREGDRQTVQGFETSNRKPTGAEEVVRGEDGKE